MERTEASTIVVMRNIPPNITAILDGNIIEEEDNEQEIESTDV